MSEVSLYTLMMLKKILKFIRSFISPNEIKFMVIFDGDQVSSKVFKRFMAVKREDTRYLWVQSNQNIPKAVLANKIEYVIAPRFGKESADSVIAIMASAESGTNKKLREVHVVSGDGDTIDMCVNLAYVYPDVTFYAVHLGNRPIKSGTTKFLTWVPYNCKFVITKGN